LRSAFLVAAFLAAMIGAAVAFPATVRSRADLRWGPGAEFPIQLVIPAGSVVDVESCGDRWCFVRFGEYEGFVRRSQLRFAAGVVVPYADYPDYEYYEGYVYGPTFVFPYYGDFHNRAVSRALRHTRAESRLLRHSRSESRAIHRPADSRRTLRDVTPMPDLLRRHEDLTRRPKDRRPPLAEPKAVPDVRPKTAPVPRLRPEPRVEPRVTPAPRAVPAPSLQPRALPAPRAEPAPAPAPSAPPAAAPAGSPLGGSR
jgi:hypothetical protein